MCRNKRDRSCGVGKGRKARLGWVLYISIFCTTIRLGDLFVRTRQDLAIQAFVVGHLGGPTLDILLLWALGIEVAKHANYLQLGIIGMAQGNMWQVYSIFMAMMGMFKARSAK